MGELTEERMANTPTRITGAVIMLRVTCMATRHPTIATTTGIDTVLGNAIAGTTATGTKLDTLKPLAHGQVDGSVGL